MSKLSRLTIDGIEYHLSDFSGSHTATAFKCDPSLSGKVVMLSSIEHEGEEYVVTSIYKMCFEESQVETLVLPTQLERIGDVYESFLHEGLGKLVSLEIDESAPYYKTIDGVLYGCLEKDPHKLRLLYIPCCIKGTLT